MFGCCLVWVFFWGGGGLVLFWFFLKDYQPKRHTHRDSKFLESSAKNSSGRKPEIPLKRQKHRAYIQNTSKCSNLESAAHTLPHKYLHITRIMLFLTSIAAAMEAVPCSFSLHPQDPRFVIVCILANQLKI